MGKIATLTAEIAEWRTQRDKQWQTIEKQGKEIERLRKALEEVRGFADAYSGEEEGCHMEYWQIVNKALEVEE